MRTGIKKVKNLEELKSLEEVLVMEQRFSMRGKEYLFMGTVSNYKITGDSMGDNNYFVSKKEDGSFSIIEFKKKRNVEEYILEKTDQMYNEVNEKWEAQK